MACPLFLNVCVRAQSTFSVGPCNAFAIFAKKKRRYYDECGIHSNVPLYILERQCSVNMKY